MPECFEPKAPQLDPVAQPVVTDSEALYKPRPNNDVEARRGICCSQRRKCCSTVQVTMFYQ